MQTSHRTSIRVLLLLLLLTAGASAHVSAQAATFSGAVFEHSTERPIANAEVSIATLRRAVRSDEAGMFFLGEIPAGVYRVTVRAVGRQPFVETIAVGTSGQIQRAFLLAPARNVLEEVSVTADGSLDARRLSEFNERRALGLGRFLTQDQLASETGRELSDVLTSRMPGLQSIGGVLASTRGAQRLSSTAPCFVRVYVDGLLIHNGGRESLFDINSLDPASVAGVEYFTVSQTPPQFNPTGIACGTIVIWTRLRVR